MPTSISDRLARQKARVEDQERREREQARKNRNRRLFTVGAMVEKAGLFALDIPALYGAMLSLESGARDEKTVARWAKAGAERITEEEAEKAKEREPLKVAFPGPVPPPVLMALKAAGLRLNRLFAEWEGLAVFSEVEAIAREWSGKITRRNPPPTESREAAE